MKSPSIKIAKTFCFCNLAVIVVTAVFAFSSVTRASGIAAYVKGSDEEGQSSVYGVRGAASPGNVPGARSGSASWIDNSGKMWLFGGYSCIAGAGEYWSDLWKFDGTNWTWVAGPNLSNQSGTANTPAARAGSFSWIDAGGKLWLFGGMSTINGVTNLFNDLWKFDGSNWTLVKGSVAPNQSGFYGTRNATGTGNMPGGREYGASWIDKSGKFWLFGGYGYDGSGQHGWLNDLWKFDGTRWIWVSGSKSVNQTGIYGSRGIADPCNVPGARDNCASATDGSGNLWLFGGWACIGGTDLYWNDLWKFDGANWTWVSGLSAAGASGRYGVKGIGGLNNMPESRFNSAMVWDHSGGLWLFGGRSMVRNGFYYNLNDLWRFDGVNWAWVSGSDVENQAGVYGDEGVSGPDNMPGARYASSLWVDASNRLWLFGGWGSDAYGLVGHLNDLWKLERAAGDLNGDGIVNEKDLNILSCQWLGPGSTGFDCADIDKAGIVNLKDFAIMARNFQTLYAGAFPVWTVDGMQRVGQDDPAGSETTARIYAAKREWEPFQIIVKAPSDGLTVSSVALSDLIGPNGSRISKENIVLYREQYLNVTHGSNKAWGPPNVPAGPGLYADGLIPFVNPANGQPIVGASIEAIPFTLASNKNQPIWVDVNVPPDASAGLYKGNATLVTDKGLATVNIELKVWNFQLPRRPYCRSVWSNTYHTKDSGGSYRQVLTAHKIMGGGTATSALYPATNTITTGFWSGADVSTCKMSSAPAASSFTNKQNTYPAEMWPYLVAYTADEVSRCPGLYPIIRQWSQNMHQSAIKNLIVMKPVPDLYDDGTGRSAVDIWVVLPKQDSDPNTHARLQYTMSHLGCDGWTYNTLVQDNFSPKWQVDFTPIQFRIQTWINSKYGYNGLLYWAIDKWENTTDYVADWQTSSASTPGDGWIVYPGGPVGLNAGQPSMRLKWLREGMDDYDYIQILKNLGDTTFALAQIEPVGPDWTNWTRDTSVMYNARKAMGDRIEQLMQPDP